jgi:hypothetical protein
MARILAIGTVVLVGMLVLGAVAVWALPPDTGAPAEWRRSGDGPPTTASGLAGSAVGPDDGSLTDLSASEIKALHLALEDECKAWSTYDQVIADFGKVRPFTNIRRADENHIAALVALFQRYGLAVPINDWPGNVATFDTLDQACEAGVQAEIDNAALYDQLVSMVDNPDIVQVFTALQQASQDQHLPAFEQCASGTETGTSSALVPMAER